MASAQHRWLKFWPQDWQRDPALRSCSLAARGLWIELLCVMHDAEPYGHLVVNGRPLVAKQIATIVGTPEREVAKLLAEMEEFGVFSRAENGAMFSRRMVRDRQVSAVGQSLGEAGGNPEIRRGTVPKGERVRPYKLSDSPAKTQRIFEKCSGRCFWCRAILDRSGRGPNAFRVDHKIAVCDGGTNDEINLVAACASCNNNRIRVSGLGQDDLYEKRPTATDTTLPTATDSNPPTATDSAIPTPSPTPTDTPHRPQTLEAEAEKKEREAADTPLPREPDRPPARPHMPRRGDKPHLWASLAESWEVDGRMVKRPVVGGSYLDVTADDACEAAGFPVDWRGDWTPLIRWLKADISNATIVEAIRSVASRPGYRPPASLAYFDNPVRQHRSAA